MRGGHSPASGVARDSGTARGTRRGGRTRSPASWSIPLASASARFDVRQVGLRLDLRLNLHLDPHLDLQTVVFAMAFAVANALTFPD